MKERKKNWFKNREEQQNGKEKGTRTRHNFAMEYNSLIYRKLT
jgi:hypothetical protein